MFLALNFITCQMVLLFSYAIFSDENFMVVAEWLANRLVNAKFHENRLRINWDIGEKHAIQVKESFSFKTRMPGTVKCRQTGAYWVHIDGINIATELITRYYSNETLIQCCFNVRPTSATLAQHWPTLDKCTMFERKSSCPANARHLYDIYAMSSQRLRRWSNIA